ncbi:hypothetical protein FRC17_003589 [Serendipita sp. 399]|nr:hypothetical protein FRC17_003589 [Serendipita sp. 399]
MRRGPLASSISASSEMRASLPHDIFVNIIRDHTSDKTTLSSLALVSRAFCEVAQRRLFQSFKLGHDARYIFQDPREMSEVLPPFRWGKLEFLAKATKLHEFVQFLMVSIYSTDQYPGHVLDQYWNQGGGRAIMDAVSRWLPPALKRMTGLVSFLYSGPSLPGPLHNAILRHKSVKSVCTVAKTKCSGPCKLAVKRAKASSIQRFEFEEIGNEVEAFGITPYPIGPRRCAFTSLMIFTHSASLKILVIPITLLYDAVHPFRDLPELPRLSRLEVQDSRFPAFVTAAMSTELARFILHVCPTLTMLGWGKNVVEEMMTRIVAAQLPNLEGFEGQVIRPAVKAARSLRVLGIKDLLVDNPDMETGSSLLQEVSSYQPNLSVLSISVKTRTLAVPRDICVFPHLTELWYDELRHCVVASEEMEHVASFQAGFLSIILPALPKLNSVCITIMGSVEHPPPTPKEYEGMPLSSSQSLRWLSLQLMFSMVCGRWDARRSDEKCDWEYTTYANEWDKLRKFRCL